MRNINTDDFLLGSITILLAISSLLASLRNRSCGSSPSTIRHVGNTYLYSIIGLAIIFQYHLLSQVSMRNVPRETILVDDIIRPLQEGKWVTTTFHTTDDQWSEGWFTLEGGCWNGIVAVTYGSLERGSERAQKTCIPLSIVNIYLATRPLWS